ncbi:MAG: HTH-type transcriptional regulator CynR [Desulfovibrio sp.]
MNERDWKLLVVLHEQKSITKASSVLHVTQPALSARLRMIEEFFGVRVVIRGKKGVQFTPEGEFLVHKARCMLTELEGIHDTLGGMQNATAGTLRIGASHFFTRYLLPPLLKRFKSLHPAVEFRVRAGWTSDLVYGVLNNEAHLAFIREDHNWTGIKRLLFSEDLLLVYSKKFSLAELPGLPQIRFANEPSHQLLIENWWVENYTVAPRVGMVVDRLDTCLEMIKVGLGYGFLPAWILHGVTGMHAKKLYHRSHAALERSTWMILKNETAELRLVREFLHMLDDVDFPTLRDKWAR